MSFQQKLGTTKSVTFKVEPMAIFDQCVRM